MSKYRIGQKWSNEKGYSLEIISRPLGSVHGNMSKMIIRWVEPGKDPVENAYTTKAITSIINGRKLKEVQR